VKLGVVLVTVFWCVACGGGSNPSGPSQDPGAAAGTVITVASGETGEPVSSATVTVNGRSYTTDARGEIRLVEAAAYGSTLEIAEGRFLVRQTSLRQSEARFTLWPRNSPTGLDEAFTKGMVYVFFSQQLVRFSPETTRVSIVPSPDIQADPRAMDAHVAGAAGMTVATGGAITFVVDPAASTGARVRMEIDPQDPIIQGGAAAITYRSAAGSVVTGGRIVYQTVAYARGPLLVQHELGHLFGMVHSTDPGDLMYKNIYVSGFSAREQLLVRLVLQRRPGNQFPDNDRILALAGAQHETVIACPGD
jgi:hypothetical protein